MRRQLTQLMLLCTANAIAYSELYYESSKTEESTILLPMKQLTTKTRNNKRMLKKDRNNKQKKKKEQWNHDQTYYNDHDIYNDEYDDEYYNNDDQYYPNGKGKGRYPPVSVPIPPEQSPPPPPFPSPPGTDPNHCQSDVAQSIQYAIPEVFTQNPTRCCHHDGPVAVYITHSIPGSEVTSITGSTTFEPFWQDAYETIEKRSALYNLCFVMTGYNPNLSQRTITDIMISTNRFVSTLRRVPVIMTTDPTDNVRLANEVRFISDSMLDGPNIGVFNSGYNNLNIEAIVARQGRLPYVGAIEDRDYGIQSALLAQQLLLVSDNDDETSSIQPLCFNGRPDLEFVGERCAAFYAASRNNITSTTEPNNSSSMTPPFGITCSADSIIEDIYEIILNTTSNSILAHVDCCSVVSFAVSRAQVTMGKKIIMGCQDRDTTGGVIDYVTKTPDEEQMYHTTKFIQLPLQTSIGTNDILRGRQKDLFPSFLSLIVTNILSFPV
jgi:hypothetical protein